MVVSQDKQWLVCAGNPQIRTFDIPSNNNTAVVSYDGHKGNVTDCGIADAGWLYTSSEDGTIKIWDIRAPSCQRDYDNGAGINAAVLSGNQGEIVVGDAAGNVVVWDLLQNKKRLKIVCFPV